MACEKCNNPFEIVDDSISCNCNSVEGTIPQSDSKCLSLGEISQFFSTLKGDNWGDQSVETCELINRDGNAVSPFTGNGTAESPLCINQDWWLTFLQLNTPSYSVYKIAQKEYNTSNPGAISLTNNIVLTGIDLTYVTDPVLANCALFEFWPEIFLLEETASSEAIEIFVEDTKVYELRTTATISSEVFVCGKISMIQDSKAPNTFLVRGEYSTVNNAGVTSNQIVSTTFTSSNTNFTVQIKASGNLLAKISGTFRLDKKPNAHFYS